MPKKTDEVEEKVDAEVVEEVEEVAAEPEKPKKKADKVSLVAKFVTIDQEGIKEVKTYTSEGESVKDALVNLDFPKGCNVLVNVTVKNGDKEYTKALAPNIARDILEFKNEDRLKADFRGII